MVRRRRQAGSAEPHPRNLVVLAASHPIDSQKSVPVSAGVQSINSAEGSEVSRVSKASQVRQVFQRLGWATLRPVCNELLVAG